MDQHPVIVVELLILSPLVGITPRPEQVLHAVFVGVVFLERGRRPLPEKAVGTAVAFADIQQDFTTTVAAVLDQLQPQGVVVQAVHAHVHQRDREAVPAAGAVQRPAPVEGNPPHGKPVWLDRSNRFDNGVKRLCDAQFHIAGAEQASRRIVGAAAPLHAIFGEVELILEPQPIDEQITVAPGTAARAAAVVIKESHGEPVGTIQIVRVFQ